MYTLAELRYAIAKLADGKAVRENDVPIDCFMAIAHSSAPAFQKFLDVCNSCWVHRDVPKEWVTARVAMIYKKEIHLQQRITDQFV